MIKTNKLQVFNAYIYFYFKEKELKIDLYTHKQYKQKIFVIGPHYTQYVIALSVYK